MLSGLFQTAEKLFDLRIKEHPGAPVWHPDVRFFDIETSAGVHIGSFYLSFAQLFSSFNSFWCPNTSIVTQ